MSKRVSVCVITIAILLIFTGFLFYVMHPAESKNGQESTETAGGNTGLNETDTDGAKKAGQAGSNDFNNGNSASDDSEIPASAEVDSSAKYVILARNGSLVVFYSDCTTEYFDTGIEVMSLPEETIDQVVAGIPFFSEEELFAFLESYSS